MATKPTKKQTAEVIIDPKLEQEIRRRAYELYEERGREHGHDLEDWLRAEAELTSKVMSTAA